MTAILIVAALGLAAAAASGWLCWTLGYRRGIDDATEAHRQAREDFLDTMQAASRR